MEEEEEEDDELAEVSVGVEEEEEEEEDDDDEYDFELSVVETGVSFVCSFSLVSSSSCIVELLVGVSQKASNESRKKFELKTSLIRANQR